MQSTSHKDIQLDKTKPRVRDWPTWILSTFIVKIPEQWLWRAPPLLVHTKIPRPENTLTYAHKTWLTYTGATVRTTWLSVTRKQEEQNAADEYSRFNKTHWEEKNLTIIWCQNITALDQGKKKKNHSLVMYTDYLMFSFQNKEHT